VPLPEFWRDEAGEERRLFRKHVVRVSLIFVGLCAAVFFAFWWSGSAVHFGASRIGATTLATYVVSGRITDAKSGAPVPWVDVRDDPGGPAPHHRALGSLHGEFALHTIAEPHELVFAALGYKPARRKVGRVWYLWMPSGTEWIDIRLEPEARAE
jgi:hypothetical protein